MDEPQIKAPQGPLGARILAGQVRAHPRRVLRYASKQAWRASQQGLTAGQRTADQVRDHAQKVSGQVLGHAETALADAVRRTTQLVIDAGAIELVAGTLLSSGLVDRLAKVLSEHPDALDNESVNLLTEQLLASPQAQMMIQRIADSPEIRKALAQQTAGIADELADGLRTRTVVADERLEGLARRLLGREAIERRVRHL